MTSYLDEQLHQVPEAAGCRPLPGAADDDAEEAAGQAQVTAGVCVQLLGVPPHLTWQEEQQRAECLIDKPAAIARPRGSLPLKEAS